MHSSHPSDSHAWYVAEVPAIVSGLQASASISSQAAATAWALIEAGSYDQALSVALSDAE
jgi:hypothetical protein